MYEMITNIKFLKKYCSEYTKIENYEEAVKSPLRYDLHHRREISENKSKKDLIAENLYYNRPPEELVFLEHGEHMRLHNAGKQYALGHHCSEETLQKISEAQKGHLVSEDTRKKMSAAQKGKNLSAETRQKISESQKGHLVSEDARQKMSIAKKGENNPNFGKLLPTETKQKLSDALKGKHWHLENGHRIWTE